jgi:nicotinamidase-related amidase
MPLTQLDPNAALVIIDLQKGITGLPTVHPMAGVLHNAAELARAFRKRNLPVVIVNVVGRAPGRTDAAFKFTPPPDWADLAPELDAQPTAISSRSSASARSLAPISTPISARATTRRTFLPAFPPAAALSPPPAAPTTSATTSSSSLTP